MRGARLLQLTLVLAFSLALSATASAKAPADDRLTNTDIVRMARAGIPESIILHEIQRSETNFVTSATALIELKNQGVSDRILDAILDSRSGTSRPHPQPVPAPLVRAQSPHRLPSFDAAVKFDSKTIGKISVRQNQINVERSGVPLFSVKWKVKRSP